MAAPLGRSFVRVLTGDTTVSVFAKNLSPSRPLGQCPRTESQRRRRRAEGAFSRSWGPSPSSSSEGVGPVRAPADRRPESLAGTARPRETKPRSSRGNAAPVGGGGEGIRVAAAGLPPRPVNPWLTRPQSAERWGRTDQTPSRPLTQAQSPWALARSPVHGGQQALAARPLRRRTDFTKPETPGLGRELSRRQLFLPRGWAERGPRSRCGATGEAEATVRNTRVQSEQERSRAKEQIKQDRATTQSPGPWPVLPAAALFPERTTLLR